jgi:hypothetical protein
MMLSRGCAESEKLSVTLLTRVKQSGSSTSTEVNQPLFFLGFTRRAWCYWEGYQRHKKYTKKSKRECRAVTLKKSKTIFIWIFSSNK